MTAPPRAAFTASEAEAGERLDRAAAARLAGQGVSRVTVARACALGLVTVNARPARSAARLRVGDAVVLELPAPEKPSAEPEAIALRVLFEDPHLLVLDKPAGMVVHPARGHASGTLVNAVLHHAAVENHEGDPLRPGIVHRLDKDTSGVLVVAKSAAAREGLKAQFQAHTIERRYEAIAVGAHPEHAVYNTLHGRHPTNRLRFSTRVHEGRRAITRATRLALLADGAAAHLSCALETGRTHQIRAHLSDAGYPLLGDALYGRPPRDARVRAAGDALGRQALHARVLGFVHPITGATLRFESAPPDDFAAALAALR